MSWENILKDENVIAKLEEILVTWETKEYPSDEARWKEYYEDIEKVVRNSKRKPRSSFFRGD